MKTKIIFLIAFSAIVTLSFSFVATRGQEAKTEPVTNTQNIGAPAGGFISEETR